MNAELYNSELRYKFTLIGRILTVEQWDEGKREVDGTKRNPQWIKVWERTI